MTPTTPIDAKTRARLTRELGIAGLAPIGELAQACNVDPRTFRRWLRGWGIEPTWIGRIPFASPARVAEKIRRARINETETA
jgi:hypothetical protein